MLFKRRFLSKVNTKRKKRGLLASSERTLGITFVLSVLFHIVAIYTIPAVDLFSEGFEGPLSDMIVVDLVQEELSEGQPAIPPPPDNQFLASQPDSEPDMPPEEDLSQPSDDPLSNPNDAEITIPLPAEKDLEMETQYTLLANSGVRDPEIEQLRKRPVKRDKPIQPKSPELPKSDKLPAEQKEIRPIEMKRSLPVQPRRPSIAPTRVENSQKKNKPEEDLNFLLEAHRPEERQFSTEELPEKMLGFDKRPAKEMNRENMPASSPSFGGASPVKRIGLNKGNEDDKNRFGVFAGDNFEVPEIKEIVQDASIAEKKKETTFSEETETAKNLDINDQIEGPVKGRAIVYQPSPPEIDIVNEVEFKLKFWMLPDGTIGEVIPLKRGDAKLERVAIAYLKTWQFEPLSPEAPQRKIWGTIPIKFTAR